MPMLSPSSRRALPIALALTVGAPILAAQSATPAAVRAWRSAHERQIVDELMTLVALPNVARNGADMRANARMLTQRFEQRGFTVTASSDSSAPVLLATMTVPRPRGTLTFYIHYDGQPVDAKEWTSLRPVRPVRVGPQGR